MLKLKRLPKYKFLSGYLLFLIVVTFIYMSFIQPHFPEATVINEEVSLTDMLYEDNGIQDEQWNSYRTDTWEMNVQDNKVQADFRNVDGQTANISIPIVTEENPELTDRAEVTLYETPIMVNVSNIGATLENRNTFHVEGNRIIVSQMDDPDIDHVFNYASIKNDMTVAQLDERRSDSFLGVTMGEQILKIELPPNTDIKFDDDVYFIFDEE